MHYVIHTDGGARGNPGPAAIGAVIEVEGRTIAKLSRYIGEATNNVAEYEGVIAALEYLRQQVTRDNSQASDVTQEKGSMQRIDFYLDSTLVANQLKGLFKVKEAHLRELLTRIRVLEQEVGGEIHYTVIPREKNTRADILVNHALDDHLYR
jgi:ribonuclease HI